MNLINYFFEIVVAQLLEYFKENAKDVPYSLLSEVLINNKNYEKDTFPVPLPLKEDILWVKNW